ncbi:LysR substrate-binding domain-containing protein [Cribrihabitans neustonicus]|uniref:LysR substrate-binding domain-containing protein n=1 Tax=Cribrihabitans neustonicus TaxID=1429085 RepID=UPI003B5AD196
MKLIQDGHRHWDRLLHAAGLLPRARVLQFNQTALAMDAAVNGQGFALVLRPFLSRQPLKAVWQAPEAGDPAAEQGFHVLWPARNGAAPAVARWLLSQ